MPKGYSKRQYNTILILEFLLFIIIAVAVVLIVML
jgi:nitrate reductase NapE component